jgi:hypothetical protein
MDHIVREIDLICMAAVLVAITAAIIASIGLAFFSLYRAVKK